LPAFLVKDSGLNSGFMISQYTAASLVSENKILAHPASVDSIPTSANQEDHVSMGTIAARKALLILSNTEFVLAIELMCAAQALDFVENLKPGEGVRVLHKLVRSKIPHLEKDRILHPDITMLKNMISTGEVLRNVEERIGRLR
jgi:histidine ammonia-lyase